MSERLDRLFALEPEVGGDWGAKTVVSNLAELETGNSIIPKVEFLEYEFNVWLGDDLLQCEACWIVTDRLARAIENSALSGATFSDVEVSFEEGFLEDFKEYFPRKKFPAFRRLIPEGKVDIKNDNEVVNWSGHDFSWGYRIDWVKPEKAELVMRTAPPYTFIVSRQCLSLLKRHNLENCEITELVSLM